MFHHDFRSRHQVEWKLCSVWLLSLLPRCGKSIQPTALKPHCLYCTLSLSATNKRKWNCCHCMNFMILYHDSLVEVGRREAFFKSINMTACCTSPGLGYSKEHRQESPPPPHSVYIKWRRQTMKRIAKQNWVYLDADKCSSRKRMKKVLRDTVTFE